MNSSVTVSVRSLVMTMVVAIALVLAYLVGVVQGDAPPATAAAPEVEEVDESSPTIVMSGSGTATGVPDQLTFKVGVKAVATDVSTSLNQASRTTSRVLEAVRAQGVDKDDLKTTGLSIHANYDYDEGQPPVITGYSVSQDLSVLVRSLPDAGKTIAAAVDAGGNAIRLSGVRLQVGDDEGLREEARTAAIEEAREKAQQYATASGTTLGDVMLVREGNVGGHGYARQSLGATAYDLARDVRAVPIKPGTADLDVAVSVVWSLK